MICTFWKRWANVGPTLHHISNKTVYFQYFAQCWPIIVPTMIILLTLKKFIRLISRFAQHSASIGQPTDNYQATIQHNANVEQRCHAIRVDYDMVIRAKIWSRLSSGRHWPIQLTIDPVFSRAVPSNTTTLNDLRANRLPRRNDNSI